MLRLIALTCLLNSSIVFSKPVDKIISLDLCSDWLLVHYAEKSQILALSSYIHRYPTNWVGLDWPTHDGSLEQILALQPDLVITGEYNAMILRQRLIDLGVNVKILTLPKSLKNVVDYEEEFLHTIGRPLDLASTPPLPGQTKNKNLLLLGANGIGTGKETFENDLLQHAGWNNYLDQSGYINLNLEELVVNPPDVIMWSAPHSQALANQFAKHPVLKKAIPKSNWISSTYWNWQCPGPWTWNLVEELNR